MTVANIAFTNPALWAGAAAIAVPLLVHLLTRKTRRTVKFPSLRFILKARASQSSLYRLRHWVLLALRTLVVAFILFAFLKPILRTRSLAASDDDTGKPTSAIVVLDASASMGYQSAGNTLFSRAKQAAEHVVEDLDTSARANLVVAGATPKLSFQEPAANKFHLRQDIRAAKLTEARADMDAALQAALAQLRDAEQDRKEIYLVSDFQRSNWAAADFAAVPPDIHMVFVPVAEPEPVNSYITEVILQPAAPTIEEDVEIICKLAHTGTRTVDIPVELRVGEDVLVKRVVTLEPGVTTPQVFRIKGHQKGVLEGEVRLPGDRLPCDDQRFFTVRVSDRVNVLVLSDEENRPIAAHRLLTTALNPFRDDRVSSVACRKASSKSLDVRPSAATDHLVVIAGVEDLSEDMKQALLQYLRDGGSVVYFLSSYWDAANLVALEQASEGDLRLPFIPGSPKFRPDGGFSQLAQANFDHALLKKFKEHGNLGDVRFFGHLGARRVKGAGQVLLRYDDTDVAMAEQTVSGGALLLCNFSPEPRLSDLAKRPVFVPLVHEMVKGLRPQRGQADVFTVGYSCSTSVSRPPVDAPLRFLSPDEQWVSAVFDTHGDEVSVIFPRAEQRGFYRVFHGDDRVGSVAVNVDRRESDLDVLNTTQLKELTQRSRAGFYAAAGTDFRGISEVRSGKPLWHYALLLALILIAVEQALWLVWR